jgi:hypothetical protein
VTWTIGRRALGLDAGKRDPERLVVVGQVAALAADQVTGDGQPETRAAPAVEGDEPIEGP